MFLKLRSDPISRKDSDRCLSIWCSVQYNTEATQHPPQTARYKSVFIKYASWVHRSLHETPHFATNLLDIHDPTP